MTTFVLVHGAWGGSYGFRHVRRLLHAAGQEVFTPSLTGIGERAHLTGPHVGLGTHVTDVVNTVLYEDLRDIVLVGFSYGGLVVTGCLDHIADRIRHLVYLDAFVPDDGDSLYGLSGAPGLANMAIGQPWLLAAAGRSFDDPDEAAFCDVRRTPQPVGSFTERVHLTRPVEDFAFERTYIRATADAPDAPASAVLDAAAERARSSDRWHYREIATNHMVPNNRPVELTTMLLELAGATATSG
ncbi:MAG: alpha/beta fold hydrolase [Ilumatobacteraceae bacterium]